MDSVPRLLMFLYGFSVFMNTPQALVKRNKEDTWPDSIVYYDITPELPIHMKTAIVQAIDYMEGVACVRWVQKRALDTHIRNYISFLYYYDRHWSEPACRAAPGLRKGQQHLLLSNGCMDGSVTKVRSRLLHLMMHALGVFHEYQRSNRDCYLHIAEELLDSFPDENTILPSPQWFSDWPFDFRSALMITTWKYTKFYPHDSRLLYLPQTHGRKPSVAHLPTFGNTQFIPPPLPTVPPYVSPTNFTMFELIPPGRIDGTLSGYDIEKIKYLYCGLASFCRRDTTVDICSNIATEEENNSWYCNKRKS